MSSSNTQRIRIKLKAYDSKILDQSTKQLLDTAFRTGASVLGPVPLPTQKTRLSVIKSPHKHKDAQEHYELKIHKRLVDIVNPTQKTIDSLMNLNLPAGVDIVLKM
jgi:small subunit ribosomal protein S10